MVALLFINGDEVPVSQNFLFSQIADFENLREAYFSAGKGKWNRKEVIEFTANLEANLISIYDRLHNRSWVPGKARNFISIDATKRRQITAPPFADRVVHHAIYRVVLPYFERKFIYHSYACRKGKGAQAAVKALQQMLREVQSKGHNPYVMQADIKSYFASIQHSHLKKAIQETIRCDDTLHLWWKVLKGYNFKGVGRPVGALTSQLEANIMLNTLDHHMSDRYGYKYLRYMDDFVVVAQNKSIAQEALWRTTPLVEKIGLCLNPKTTIFPLSHGVDWCGYRTWPTHILPRKRNVKAAKKRIQKTSSDLNSNTIDIVQARKNICNFTAYMKHCNGWTTVDTLLKNNFNEDVLCKLNLTY